MDLDFKLNKQISSVLKKILFQFRQIAKIKPVLSRHDLKEIIHAFISTWLEYCNAPYTADSQASISCLQLVQCCWPGTHRHEHISTILSSLHWLPVYHRINLKVLMLAYKSLNSLGSPYISYLSYFSLICPRGPLYQLTSCFWLSPKLG